MPQVTILYFASIGELLSRERESRELPDRVTSDEILALLSASHPSAATLLETCRLAVDCEFVTGPLRLLGGEEIAVLPPVCGG